VRTNLGYKAFRLDTVGALEFAYSQIGSAVLETRALSSSAFGGAGLVPLNPAKAPASAPRDAAGGGD
jgi:hypothetical protein